MEQLQIIHRTENYIGAMRDALRGCLGAMLSMAEQIEQMRGMFNDEDGTIQEAMEAGEDAEAQARAVLAHMPMIQADQLELTNLVQAFMDELKEALTTHYYESEDEIPADSPLLTLIRRAEAALAMQPH